MREGAVQDYVYDPARFAAMAVPTLLLTGKHSPPTLTAAAHRLAADLPDAWLRVLPGQEHIAMDTAPDLFVREVTEFLEE